MSTFTRARQKSRAHLAVRRPGRVLAFLPIARVGRAHYRLFKAVDSGLFYQLYNAYSRLDLIQIRISNMRQTRVYSVSY